ncbi:MAG: IS110 family transposase [Oscillospiraceae bacterium]
MNAVGIDVSKGKSMVAALRPMGEVALLPKEYPHSQVGLEQMAYAIIALGEDTRVVMEATGRYHEPVAATLHEYGIYVTVLNPLLIKQSGGGSIRKVKTDKADAIKIAKYGLDNWVDLREYTPMEAVRQQLKLCSRQYNLYMKTIVALQNNLISLTDKTFPGVNELFKSPERADGHQKWVDFVLSFWHCECVCHVSEASFIERYRKWCKRKGYNFSEEKALSLYADSCGHITTLPKNDNTKLLITIAAQQLLAAKTTLVAMRTEMLRLAKLLPEYETVLAMYGVGEITAAQLMAEIGDVRRYPRRSSLVAFAGVDPAVNQSGKHEAQSNPTTKRGSPHLRKTLYQVVCTYLKKSPGDEAVYRFLDKKRAEGKPYFVYMTAAANKFLRIYYARVKECLAALDDADITEN